MGTKTISLSDEAYARLKRDKQKGESFSDVVLRLTGRQDLSKYAGTISPGFAEELRSNVQAFRDRFDREFRHRVGDRWEADDEDQDGEGT